MARNRISSQNDVHLNPTLPPLDIPSKIFTTLKLDTLICKMGITIIILTALVLCED